MNAARMPFSSTEPGRPLVSFRQVSLALGDRTILQNIDLDIARGEFVCVIGHSGCGKTSMLRLIAGLATPREGELLYEGRPVKSPRRDVSVVFQDYGKALLPWRTAAGNVALALEAANVPRAQRDLRIDLLLEKMDLAQHRDKFPSQMSGGMQQRLQIARCLAQEPALLLMDEPFGALDAMTRQALQDEVLAIARTTETTVFFVTHDLEEAIYLADRVIALKANPGRIDRIFQVRLPYPRDQLSTREHPEFLRLRRELFDFFKEEA